MTDKCSWCKWTDVEDCHFSPGECIETHLRMAHSVKPLEAYLEGF